MWSRLVNSRQSLARFTRRYTSGTKTNCWYEQLPIFVQEARQSLEQRQEKCLIESIKWLDDQFSTANSNLAKSILQRAKSGDRTMIFYYADIPVSTFFNPQEMNKTIIEKMNAKYKGHFKFVDCSSPYSNRYFTISW